ncbi:MAG: hypothetical protein K1X53_02755 [Candidatus Sumerlaeaceae bacterium]|nr:hypothetical protein [Candidatus Sumerlaeaceae bacterium]
MRKIFGAARRAFTIVEIIVVVGIGTVVFGLILGAFIETQREADRLLMEQELHREGLVIGRMVERIIRFRLPAGELASGGAGQDAAAGGETTATAAKTVAPQVSKTDKFTAGELTVLSLALGTSAEEILCGISNGTSAGSRHVMLKNTSAEGEGGRSKPLGSNTDRYQSEISFRYASEFKGTDAVWKADASATPRLVEFAVRVWPNRPTFKNFADAKDGSGRNLGFTFTSAVAVP